MRRGEQERYPGREVTPWWGVAGQCLVVVRLVGRYEGTGGALGRSGSEQVGLRHKPVSMRGWRAESRDRDWGGRDLDLRLLACSHSSWDRQNRWGHLGGSRAGRPGWGWANDLGH